MEFVVFPILMTYITLSIFMRETFLMGKSEQLSFLKKNMSLNVEFMPKDAMRCYLKEICE